MSQVATTIERYFESQFKCLNDLARAKAENDEVLVEHYKFIASEEFELIGTECVQKCTTTTGPLLKAWTTRLIGDAALDPFPAVEGILSLLAQAKQAAESCLILASMADSWGRPLACFSNLQFAAHDIDEKIAEIKDNWPIIDESAERKSKDNYDRGNAKDAEEIFDALHTAGR